MGTFEVVMRRAGAALICVLMVSLPSGCEMLPGHGTQESFDQLKGEAVAVMEQDLPKLSEALTAPLVMVTSGTIPNPVRPIGWRDVVYSINGRLLVKTEPSAEELKSALVNLGYGDVVVKSIAYGRSSISGFKNGGRVKCATVIPSAVPDYLGFQFSVMEKLSNSDIAQEQDYSGERLEVPIPGDGADLARLRQGAVQLLKRDAADIRKVMGVTSKGSGYAELAVSPIQSGRNVVGISATFPETSCLTDNGGDDYHLTDVPDGYMEIYVDYIGNNFRTRRFDWSASCGMCARKRGW